MIVAFSLNAFSISGFARSARRGWCVRTTRPPRAPSLWTTPMKSAPTSRMTRGTLGSRSGSAAGTSDGTVARSSSSLPAASSAEAWVTVSTGSFGASGAASAAGSAAAVDASAEGASAEGSSAWASPSCGAASASPSVAGTEVWGGGGASSSSGMSISRRSKIACALPGMSTKIASSVISRILPKMMSPPLTGGRSRCGGGLRSLRLGLASAFSGATPSAVGVASPFASAAAASPPSPVGAAVPSAPG